MSLFPYFNSKKKIIHIITTMEIYKDIEGFKGLYQISNLGNVKSLGNSQKRKEKVLKPAKNNRGYLYVCLCNQEIRKIYKIHRLVAEAFVPNPNNLPEVNHKDENKTNNADSNLEWCDHKYNINYGTHTERSAASRKNNKKQSKQVMCLETGVIYPSTSEVEREFGFSRGNISAVCRGKTKTAYKFHWKYVS